MRDASAPVAHPHGSSVGVDGRTTRERIGPSPALVTPMSFRTHEAAEPGTTGHALRANPSEAIITA